MVLGLGTLRLWLWCVLGGVSASGSGLLGHQVWL